MNQTLQSQKLHGIRTYSDVKKKVQAWIENKRKNNGKRNKKIESVADKCNDDTLTWIFLIACANFDSTRYTRTNKFEKIKLHRINSSAQENIVQSNALAGLWILLWRDDVTTTQWSCYFRGNKRKTLQSDKSRIFFNIIEQWKCTFHSRENAIIDFCFLFCLLTQSLDRCLQIEKYFSFYWFSRIVNLLSIVENYFQTLQPHSKKCTHAYWDFWTRSNFSRRIRRSLFIPIISRGLKILTSVWWKISSLLPRERNKL